MQYCMYARLNCVRQNFCCLLTRVACLRTHCFSCISTRRTEITRKSLQKDEKLWFPRCQALVSQTSSNYCSGSNKKNCTMISNKSKIYSTQTEAVVCLKQVVQYFTVLKGCKPASLTWCDLVSTALRP